MKRIFIIAVLFCGSFTTYGQDRNALVQQRIEFISEQLETEEIDLTDLIEILYYRLEHPLNLNSASKEQLKELGLLTDVQINDLLLHRNRFGKLITIYELQSLRYWDLPIISMILPFVRVDDRFDQLHVSFKEAIKRGNFELYGRYQRALEQKKGYNPENPEDLYNKNSYYHGNPDKYYTRFRYSYRTNLSFGITAEKDPGEQFFKGSQKQGFDFYSLHAFYKGGKYLRSVAIGDYQVQIGQGLNLWSGYGFGKTADAVNVKKSANPLKPYTSVDEVRFLRGAAMDLAYNNFELTLFGSVKNVDGSVQIVDTDSVNVDEVDYELGSEYVTSVNLTGFHRTNTEIARKGSLRETIFGGNLRYEKRNLHLGVALVNWGYDKEFNKPWLPYNQFDFRGKNTTSISADYSYVLRNFHFFGEASYVSHSNSWANIHGVLFSIDSKATMTVMYRNYQRGYETFYNVAFAESGRMANNERGLYTGLNVNITRSLSLNAYFDMFKFPWLKYQVDQPSHGHEILIQPTYRPNRNFEVYVRFRQQLRQKNSSISDGTITEIEDVVQRNYRINISYKVSDDFTLKSRIEYVTLDQISKGHQDGILFTQDFIYKPKKLPIELTLRYALFDTDSYDTRLYSFESNALYVYSIPAYYYQGNRAYALIRLTLFKKADLWIRYGAFLYNNRTTVGAGSELINGNRKSDITVQLRVKF